MKTTKLLLIAVILFSSILCAEEAQNSSSMIRFTIDKKTYETFSSTQQAAIGIMIQELTSFVDNTIVPALPASVKEKTANLKIKVQLTNTAGIDGLFTPSEGGSEHTISIQLMQLTSNGIKSILAHEIYHAIHYYVNPDEYPWVREGMAQMFEYYMTGNYNGSNIASAMKSPMTPLLGVYDVEEIDRSQYGHNLLYFIYLMNHCGGQKTFWKITEGNATREKGSYLIDAVLKDVGSPLEECTDFPSSAINFEVAKMHNQPQYKKPQEKNKFVVAPMLLNPKLPQVETEKELQQLLKKMPNLSSYKIPFEKFLKLNGKCKDCEIYYADRIYPYGISQTAPRTTKDIEVILVKAAQ